MVDAARNERGNRHAKAHRALLKELSRNNMRGLDEADLAVAYNYLCDEIEDRARSKNRYIVTKTGEKLIDERRFPKEMKLLRQLSAHYAYSPKLTDWMAKKRHAFDRELAHDKNFQSSLKRWPEMSQGERATFITNLIARRTKSFSDGDFQFTPPAVEIADLVDSLGLSWMNENKISLNKSLFESDNPTLALKIAYHEGTHNLISQMGLLHQRGMVREGHPLYDDINKAAIRDAFYSGSRSCFPELYAIDPEEQLCNHEGVMFTFELASGTFLRARFEAAKYIVRETLHGHPPSLKRAMDILQLK